MTPAHALSLAAEFCFVVFAILGLFCAGILIGRLVGLWRRRTREDLSLNPTERMTIKTIARHRRDDRFIR